MKRPSVNLTPVASHYAMAHERIIEFTSESGGGLISFTVQDGSLVIDVYRTDPTVIVRHLRKESGS